MKLQGLSAIQEDVAPIPGTKRRKCFEKNAAADIKVTLAEIAGLESAVLEDEVAGERYAVANMKAIDQ